MRTAIPRPSAGRLGSPRPAGRRSGLAGIAPPAGRPAGPRRRRTRRPLLLVLGLVVVAVACGPLRSGGDRAPGPAAEGSAPLVDNHAEPRLGEESGEVLRFELEQRFGTDDGPFETILTAISGVTSVDDRGNIYLVMRGPRVVSFAPDGSVRWSVERQGQAPGELSRSVSGVVWDGADSLFLLNGKQTRLDEWTTSGQFVRSGAVADVVPGQAHVLRLAGLVEGRTLVVLDEYEGHIGFTLLLIDASGEDWRLRERRAVDVGDGIELDENRALVPMVRAEGDAIAVGNLGERSFRLLDAGGDLRLVAAVATERFGRPQDEDGDIEPRGDVTPPLRLASGHWLVHARWPVDGGEADGAGEAGATGGEMRPAFRGALDLFDAGGVYLAAQAFEGSRPEIGYPLMTGPDGRLYTICADAFIQICRYRVHLDLPEAAG